jgi:hypothetical protein
MTQIQTTPFDTIESAQDFVRVLCETVAEARQEVEQDYNRALELPPSRHRDALQIAVYNMDRLEKHLASSRRILNDLRSLRRLLFAEREFRHVKAIGSNQVSTPEATPAVVTLIPAPRRVGVAVSRTYRSTRGAIPA